MSQLFLIFGLSLIIFLPFKKIVSNRAHAFHSVEVVSYTSEEGFLPDNRYHQGKSKMIQSLKVAALAVLFAGLSLNAHATTRPSVALGEKLFCDPKLGGATGSKTCAGCHQDGAGIEFSFQKPNLPQIINMCITRGLNGAPLEMDSVEMNSLILYHQSFR
jgi:cytochrome c peroxidase